MDVLSQYTRELRRVDGRLYLTGIRSEAYRQIARATKLRLAGSVAVYEATPILFESTRRAIADARDWLARLDEKTASGAGDGT